MTAAEIIEALLAKGWRQDDIAKRIGASQPTVSRIRKKGQSPLEENASALTLLAEAEGLIPPRDGAAGRVTADAGSGVRVPLYTGKVSAGRLADIERELPPGDRELVLSDLGRGEFLALPVEGDSMDRFSPEGSIIIVNRRETVLHRGKPYVFIVRGQMTYKLWEPSPAPRLDPHSWNAINKPIFVDKRANLGVLGRVRRTMLDM